jgi:hypothetical protein
MTAFYTKKRRIAVQEDLRRNLLKKEDGIGVDREGLVDN